MVDGKVMSHLPHAGCIVLMGDTLIKLKLYCPCGSYIVLMQDILTKIKLYCPVVSYIFLITRYIIIKVKLHCLSDKG